VNALSHAQNAAISVIAQQARPLLRAHWSRRSALRAAEENVSEIENNGGKPRSGARNGNGHTAKQAKPVAPAKRVVKRLRAEAVPVDDRKEDPDLVRMREGLRALHRGDFSVRMSTNREGLIRELSDAFNQMAGTLDRVTREYARVSKVVGRDGDMTERVSVGDLQGGWLVKCESFNSLIGDLVRPSTEVARVITAVAEGDLSQKMALEIEGKPVRGEFLRIGTTVNTMVDQLRSFAAEVTRVAREVGTEGKLGGQANVPGVAGTWKDLTDSVNAMAANLTTQVRGIAGVVFAVANGDLSKRLVLDAKGEVAALADTINNLTDTLRVFAEQVTTVAREVGTEGKLGGQARVPGVAGTWKASWKSRSRPIRRRPRRWNASRSSSSWRRCTGTTATTSAPTRTPRCGGGSASACTRRG
jgi:methyl-accepting chemotaxis protein